EDEKACILLFPVPVHLFSSVSSRGKNQEKTRKKQEAASDAGAISDDLPRGDWKRPELDRQRRPDSLTGTACHATTCWILSRLLPHGEPGG
ncbi:MAG: hypothetical protein ACPIOQ_45215, partial [Promethearchaeia archaeon]